MNIKCICIYDRKRRDEEKACYGKLLGCFYDEGPFDYLDMLPSPPELVSINQYKYISYHNHLLIITKILFILDHFHLSIYFR